MLLNAWHGPNVSRFNLLFSTLPMIERIHWETASKRRRMNPFHVPVASTRIPFFSSNDSFFGGETVTGNLKGSAPFRCTNETSWVVWFQKLSPCPNGSTRNHHGVPLQEQGQVFFVEYHPGDRFPKRYPVESSSRPQWKAARKKPWKQVCNTVKPRQTANPEQPIFRW